MVRGRLSLSCTLHCTTHTKTGSTSVIKHLTECEWCLAKHKGALAVGTGRLSTSPRVSGA